MAPERFPLHSNAPNYWAPAGAWFRTVLAYGVALIVSGALVHALAMFGKHRLDDPTAVVRNSALAVLDAAGDAGSQSVPFATLRTEMPSAQPFPRSLQIILGIVGFLWLRIRPISKALQRTIREYGDDMKEIREGTWPH